MIDVLQAQQNLPIHINISAIAPKAAFSDWSYIFIIISYDFNNSVVDNYLQLACWTQTEISSKIFIHIFKMPKSEPHLPYHKIFIVTAWEMLFQNGANAVE